MSAEPKFTGRRVCTNCYKPVEVIDVLNPVLFQCPASQVRGTARVN